MKEESRISDDRSGAIKDEDFIILLFIYCLYIEP